MPAFTVTAPSDTYRLDSTGKGEVSFTVSNRSGNPKRGMAKLEVLGNTRKEWLSVAGEVERDFPVDGVHQFTVKIAAPPGTDAGRYTFRLDITSSSGRTDEDRAEGPTVAFEVPRAADPKKPFRWWIPAAAVVVLVCLGVGVWLWLRPQPQEGVPDVVSLSKDQASQKLSESGLQADWQVDWVAGKDKDVVLRQDPEHGAPVPDNKTIAVFLQDTTLTVPNLTNQGDLDAALTLQKAGFGVPVVTWTPVAQEQDRRVLRVDPPADTPVRVGSVLTLTIGQKRPDRPVPPWLHGAAIRVGGVEPPDPRVNELEPGYRRAFRR